MISTLATYNINSPEHGRQFKVDIVDGLDQAHLDYIESSWQPILDELHDVALLEWWSLPSSQRTDEKFADILGRLAIPDQHWSWRKKTTYAQGTNRKVYGVVHDGHVEAAMMLKFGSTSRLNPVGQPLVYVDYVSAAPWNRSAIQPVPRFNGMGSLMLGVAIGVSRSRNCDGRCGLHALPSAEGFYRRIGMHKFPSDPNYHNMRYFEFDALSARTFTD